MIVIVYQYPPTTEGSLDELLVKLRAPVVIDGTVLLGAPTTAPPDAQMDRDSGPVVAVWVDEAANKIKFKVRYSDGVTFKNGELPLT